MTPASGRVPLTEEEYWRDYGIISDDVNAAMVSCYTHRAINHIAAQDRRIFDRLNRQPEFWRVTAFSLQNTLFIVLSRILDPDPGLHSIYQVLNATTAHPEFFSKAALRARKLSIPGTRWDDLSILDRFAQGAWEPTVQDLRQLKKDLAPYKTKFDAIYKPIRNQIAHNILKDQALVADLYSKTQKKDVDELLCFLHSLIQSLWQLAFNGQQPDLKGDNYGYASRVAEITKQTESLLRALP